MQKLHFAINKLQNEIITEVQTLYAEISMNCLTHDHEGYVNAISKLIAAGEALGLTIDKEALLWT